MEKIKSRISNIFPCIIYSALCGIVTGSAIFLFKFAAGKAEKLSRLVYSYAKSSPLYVIAILAALAVFALIMVLIHKKIPEANGGGIPRSEGVLRGLLSFKWLRTLIGTLFGSLLSFVCGVPVGSEGPSVLIGTSLGSMCLGKSKDKSAWSRYVMTGGAGAGFAVATGAPLSGILFALEEIHKRFTPMLVMAVSISVITASYVNQLLCSLFSISPNLFEINGISEFKLSQIFYLILFGLIIALSVAAYDVSIALVNRFTSRFKGRLTPAVKMIIVFLLTGILCLYFADGAYNGHHMIVHIIDHTPGIWLLLLYLIVRFIMMVLVTDSGVTGGSFIPTLAIGALVSAIASKFLMAIGMPNELLVTVILIGMCAFIGGTLRAPLTAAVLFIELTGHFVNILYVALVIFTVNAMTELFHLTPFYERAIDKMVERQHGDRKAQIAHFKTVIQDNAFVVGKSVRDVMWPSSTVVISIKRANEGSMDMCNDGEKKLYSGDTIVLRSKYYDESELTTLIHSLVGESACIHKIEM